MVQAEPPPRFQTSLFAGHVSWPRSPGPGMVLKVHTSNYRIEGFTTEVSPRDLAALAHARSLPMMDDLGSGTLADFTRLGLPRDGDALAHTVDATG